MHIISHKKIVQAQLAWPQCSDALDGWYRIMKRAEPQNASELKRIFPSMDKVGAVYVFNIGGHRLRLIASVRYRVQRVYLLEILSHREYDKERWKK